MKLTTTKTLKTATPLATTIAAAIATGTILLAFANLAHAGDTDNPQIVIHSTHAEEDARAFAKARLEQQQILESWFKTLAQNAVTPHDPKMRALYNDWLKRNRVSNEQAKRILAVDRLGEGDPIALDNLYDNEATIRMYLHDSGYNDLSDAEITKISAYMKANHIHHISEIGQP